MTDELYKDTTNYPAKTRAVIRDGVNKLYYVYEWSGHIWQPTGRGYRHSTSAYAVLGRITNREAQAFVLKGGK